MIGFLDLSNLQYKYDNLKCFLFEGLNMREVMQKKGFCALIHHPK